MQWRVSSGMQTNERWGEFQLIESKPKATGVWVGGGWVRIALSICALRERRTYVAESAEIMKDRWRHPIASLRNVICLSFLVLGLLPTVEAQMVTIDFDFSKPVQPSPFPPYKVPPDWGLPWHEDGFVVGSTNRTDFAQITGTVPPRSGPPYPGFLTLFGVRGMSSVTITNETSLTFDLLSVDVLNVGPGVTSPTNYARIISSAGGVFGLLGTPNGTRVQLPNDSQWQNLTFMRIEYLTSTFSLDGLQLDNFVVQVNSVPEPSTPGLVGLAGFVMVLIHRRIDLISSIDSGEPA